MYLTTNTTRFPRSRGRLPLLLACVAALAGPVSTGWAQTAEPANDGPGIHRRTSLPALALKEEMIRDRFQRFEDRIYRLRERLADVEPDNAAKLARVLQRGGELGLADQLDDLIEILKSPATLPRALEAQTSWLADADRLLAILLERDSDNQERREEIERLQEYNEKIADLLAREKALRSATGQGNLAERMLSQLNESIRRVDALLQRQSALSEQTTQDAGKSSPGESQGEKLARAQGSLSEDTKQLAEDLKRLSDLKPEADRDSPELEAAREKTKAAAQSAQKGAGKMSGAGEQMQQPGGGSPSEQQEQAEEALKKAREQLEQAKRELEKRLDSQEQAQQQEKIAQETGELSQQMQQDASSQSGQGSEQSQQGSPSKSPGQQSVQKAQEEMNKAAQSLKQSKGDEAGESQDQAIDQLEQAKKELEEALAQLRQEEREEALRDLEVRFRKMLAGQRGVNDGTVQLDQFGADNFGRAEHLQLAELSTRQRNLATDAEVCRHILEEDGSTIVFPRVLEQLGEDMTTVALRLAAFKVASLTQTIEGEIIDTLEQLLEALQQMQQENEQQGGQPQQEGESKESPLLPPSAELKLLRAAQMRVNTRTVAVATAREEMSDTEASLAETLRGVALRQRECGSIAEEMRASQQSP